MEEEKEDNGIDFMKLDLSDSISRMILRLPFVCEWVEFKGETCYSESQKKRVREGWVFDKRA